MRVCNMKKKHYSLVLERLRIVFLFAKIVKLILLLLNVAFNYRIQIALYEPKPKMDT